ncbi:zinc-dependent metalloprotease [Sanguibacter suaedae]|uniref:Zinc-dependent metalloprotease n=1 Tax=Sanguibacter suaedae TaxID=2795737 RepID=A0A934MAS6_9MICO|nr:zinc-dependent metalloprotease [Sanguibacter suaedae]MBI9116098.1 zinc-dependent metalloprotease [Sanguibacter suaedae]
MSSDPSASSGAPDPSQWEEMLRSLFGADSEEALRELRARGFDPQALAAGSGFQNDPQMLQQVLDQVKRLLSASGGDPVNADVAHDVARQVAVAEGDPVLTAKQVREATDALSVADLWLDAATELPPSGGTRTAWSRSEWVEQTLPAWNALAAPVAASVADALAAVLRDQLPEGGGLEGMVPGLPPGLLGGAGPIDPTQMMRQLGSAVFGMQIGTAAGTLSREVHGATDIGVPLLTGPATVLLPTNVAAFTKDLDVPAEEVRHFLALREAAHARLFTHVTWLRGHLLGLVEAYARGITIDMDALESSLRDVDPTDPEALRGALSGGVFGLHSTPEQEATLLRLETVLALVEGWVDEVVARAALPHLPHTVALREMIRRRRAAGGPAEQTFASLVGLELRPRRSRDAATLWSTIDGQVGSAARDAVWDHPDLLPSTLDLDDPAGYFTRRDEVSEEQSDVDRALAELFKDGDDAQDGEAPKG